MASRFVEAFRVWLRVAILSFGGPAGQIAVMHKILVEEKRWVSENRFLHALNYCMLLPGPEAQQLATYIGWLMHGTRGGIMAGGLFIVPGIVAIMALSYIYAAFGNVGIVTALFFGLKAAVLAIVVEAVVRVGKRALKNNVVIGLAAAAFVGIFFFNVPFPDHRVRRRIHRLFRDASRVSAVFERRRRPWPGKGRQRRGLPQSLLSDELPAHAQPSIAQTLRIAAVWLRSGWCRLRCCWSLLGHGNVFSQIALFFSKMAMVTFGGAYAVLAYVAQQAVEGLPLAEARRDARRARHGRDDAGAADHGAAVRRLHGRLSRARCAVADAGRNAWAGCSPPG